MNGYQKIDIEKAKDYGSYVAKYMNRVFKNDIVEINNGPVQHNITSYGTMFKNVITAYGKCDRFIIPSFMVIKSIDETIKPVCNAARENLFGPAQHYDKTEEITVKILENFRKGFVENIDKKEYKDAIIYLKTPWNIETDIIIDLYCMVI